MGEIAPFHPYLQWLNWPQILSLETATLSRAGCCAFPDAVHSATGLRSSSLPSFLLEEILKFLHKDGEKIGLTKILHRCANLERAFCKFFIRQWLVFVGEKRKRLLIGSHIKELISCRLWV